jgi:hypothetical protein
VIGNHFEEIFLSEFKKMVPVEGGRERQGFFQASGLRAVQNLPGLETSFRKSDIFHNLE